MDKITKQDPLSISHNSVADNVAELMRLFPEVVTEDTGGKRIDFARLRALLGEAVAVPEERYSFTWHGKTQAGLIAQTPTSGTLRPCREESVNWDTGRHLFIEGDNLEVLKLLQKSYHRQVKMIYIDPPYNTGKEFIYADRFQDNLDSYLRYTGQLDEQGRKLSANAETSGRYHTNWLNMIYPRLKLARNLLRDDGVLVVHIDEHEHANLEKLLDELYGEENNLGTIVWDKRNPKGDAKGIAYQHEYILLYAKNRDHFAEHCRLERPKQNASKILRQAEKLIKRAGGVTEQVRAEFKSWIATQDFSGGEKAYCLIDDEGEVYRPVSMAWPNKKRAPDAYFQPLIHPVTGKPCPVPARGWRNPPNTMRELMKSGRILFGSDESTVPNRKYLLKDNLTENVPSLLYHGGSDDAVLKELELDFDNPKVVQVSKSLIASIANSLTEEDIILDFFAGSCTTAHTVLDLNREDGGKRRFIMVQLPEPCDSRSGAFKAGYQTIAEIGKHRIRRVIERFKADHAEEGGRGEPGGDLGVKVFKLDTSNLRAWEAEAETLEEQLALSVDTIKPARSDEDVLYEILLKQGLDLSSPVECDTLAGGTLYAADQGRLLVCLADEVSLEMVEAIGQLLQAKDWASKRIVFKDAGFASDAVKLNALQVLKRFGLADVKTV